MQKMNKNGFSQCAGAYIERLRKEGRYSTAHVIRMLFFLLVSFVEQVTYRSGKSPGNVYDAMDSIFTSPG